MRSGLLLLLASLMALTAASPDRPRIVGVSYVAFFVHDLEAARAYYTKFLGYDEPLPQIVRINSRQYVELLPEDEGGSDRLSRIGVQTDNAEAMRQYLQSRGVSVPDRVARDRFGNPSFTITDPDGHLVEVVQYSSGTWKRLDGAGAGTAISPEMRHTGILVGALEPAMTFYRGVFGFKEIWRGSRDEKTLDWVNMEVADGRDYLEFMLYRDRPEPSRRGSQHHICLIVPDVEKAAATLRARAGLAGYTRPLEIRVGVNRKRQLNLYDPDGTRTELMEPGTIDGKPAASSTAPPPRGY
jgi:catechol 2,3-dioxygenase-like lactoylglutathione lyase family enzyme